jgi:hypothetical protein
VHGVTVIRPNFFIIGAPKSGTTALSEYLRSHPDVFFSTPKEPHHFSPDIRSRHRIDKLADYEALFATAPAAARVVGEGSVHYLQSTVAVANILAYAPSARILVMLRNPVDLAASWHAEAQYSEFETERSFEAAWRERVVRGVAFRGRGDPQLMDYAAVASIGTQTRRVVAQVPRAQLKLVLFDDFVADAGQVYRDVLSFLGLADDGRAQFPTVNDSKRVRSLALMQLSHAVASVKRRIGLRAGLGLLEAMNVRRQGKDALSPAFRASLVRWFEPEMASIEDLLDVNLPHWRR